MDTPNQATAPPANGAPPPVVVMLGTDFTAPGGITAVLRTYRDAGVFATWPVRFLATYRNRFPGDRLGTALLALGHFLSWLLTGQVAGVHAHTAGRGSFWRKSVFLLLARAWGHPTVLHLHDGTFPTWVASLGPWRRRAVRGVLERVSQVWVLTPGWRGAIAALAPRATFRVLANPVDWHPGAQAARERELQSARQTQAGGGRAGTGQGRLRVLFLGRLWREKGVFDLVEAVGVAVARDPSLAATLRVTCGGDGNAAPLLARARQLGVAECFAFPGWVEGAAREALWAATDLFVLPSYFEGLPMGVLEAMGRGIPVLATQVGGIPDALGAAEAAPDGPDAALAGLLVAPGDVAALATALADLAADGARRARLGAAGEERVRTVYAKERVLAEMARLYRELGWLPGIPAGGALDAAPGAPTVEPS